MLKIVALFALISCSFVNGEYTTFKWSTCHTSTPGFTITELDIKPMPIVYPGLHNVKANIIGPRGLKGILKVELTILRTIAGLALPVRCYIVTGPFGAQSVGSCTYQDTCTQLIRGVFGYNKDNCPAVLLAAGLNCECPFNRDPDTIVINEALDFPPTLPVYFEFLASGDFDVTLKMNDGPNASLYFGCVKVGFTMKKRLYKEN